MSGACILGVRRVCVCGGGGCVAGPARSPSGPANFSRASIVHLPGSSLGGGSEYAGSGADVMRATEARPESSRLRAVLCGRMGSCAAAWRWGQAALALRSIAMAAPFVADRVRVAAFVLELKELNPDRCRVSRTQRASAAHEQAVQHTLILQVTRRWGRRPWSRGVCAAHYCSSLTSYYQPFLKPNHPPSIQTEWRSSAGPCQCATPGPMHGPSAAAPQACHRPPPPGSAAARHRCRSCRSSATCWT
jgi:hypothetical protein